MANKSVEAALSILGEIPGSPPMIAAFRESAKVNKAVVREHTYNLITILAPARRIDDVTLSLLGAEGLLGMQRYLSLGIYFYPMSFLMKPGDEDDTPDSFASIEAGYDSVKVKPSGLARFAVEAHLTEIVDPRDSRVRWALTLITRAGELAEEYRRTSGLPPDLDLRPRINPHEAMRLAGQVVDFLTGVPDQTPRRGHLRLVRPNE